MTDAVAAARFDGPSVDNFRALLQSFAFVSEVEIHTKELPFWATEYDILCSLLPASETGFDLDDARRQVLGALQLAITPWRTKVKCVVREHGPDGDVKESIWRLGGEAQ